MVREANKEAKKKPYELFADQIMVMLAQGVAPWQKSWKAGEYYSPFNPVSGTVYSGLNRLMLSNSDMADPRWMTFRQAQQKGYRIKSGSKATPIEYWQWTKEIDKTDDNGRVIYGSDGKPEKEIIKLDRPRVFYSSVFHAAQVETEDREPIPAYEPPPIEWNPHEKAEAILENSKADIHHDQRDRAYYSPREDSIHLPYRENFSKAGDYYNTALHELGHWACSKRRLDMEGGVFGSESYGREELRVEIASWMICQDLGLDFEPESSAAYVDHWMRNIKEDPYEIVRACRDAEKIKRYVLSLEQGLEKKDPFAFVGLESSHTPAEMPAFRATEPTVENLSGEALFLRNLENPGDFQFQYPRFAHLTNEASPEDKAWLSKVHREAIDLVSNFLDDDVCGDALIESRRAVLASALMDLDFLHHQMVNLDLIPSESAVPYLDRSDLLTNIGRAGDLHSYRPPEPAPVLEALVRPDRYRFLYPDYAPVTQDSPIEDKQMLLKAYSRALEMFEICSNEHRFGDIDLPTQRNTRAATLLDLNILHNQAQAIGLMSDNEPLPYHTFADTLPVEETNQLLSPAEKLSGLIERSSMRCAVALDAEAVALALLTTRHITRKGMESLDYNAPGTEVESKLLALISRETERFQASTLSEEGMASIIHRIVVLGNIQGNRMDSAYNGLYQKSLQNYGDAYEYDQGEMDLLSGKNTSFKQGFDQGEKDWCVDWINSEVLCRENEGEPWREASDADWRMLSAVGDFKIALAITLDDGSILTFDGQTHLGPEKKVDIERVELEAAVFQRAEFVNSLLEFMVDGNLGAFSEHKFRTILEIVEENREAPLNKGDAAIEAFFDKVQAVCEHRVSEASKIWDGRTGETIEGQVFNSALEILAASRELGYPGLAYASNELPGPKFRVVSLCSADDSPNPNPLKHKGHSISHLREVRDGENPLVYAVTHLGSNEVVSGFDYLSNAEGFAKALNGREIELIQINEPQYRDEPVYLQVPYKEKNQAKAAGAKWDAKAKLWMAPAGADLTGLAKWIPEREPEPAPAISPEDELRKVMMEAGLKADGSLILDGKIHRVPVEGGKGGSRDGAYCGHLDGVPNGWVMNHKTGANLKWVTNGHTMSEEQINILKGEVKRHRRESAAEREKGYQQAAERAFDKLFADGVESASPDHPYLKDKGVYSFGLHQDQAGNLLIEGIDLSQYHCVGRGPEPPQSPEDLQPHRYVQTLQTITPEGKKRFEAGTKKTGAAFLIGEHKLKEIAFDQWRERSNSAPLLSGLDWQPKPVILVSEGYATGATLHKATGLPVAVAFDAGNLKPVAETLSEKFPSADLVLCADNDHANKINVGVQKAQAAAQAVSGRVLIPEFTDEEKARGLTDFNDLAQSRGLFAVTQLVSPKYQEYRQLNSPQLPENSGLSR